MRTLALLYFVLVSAASVLAQEAKPTESATVIAPAAIPEPIAIGGDQDKRYILHKGAEPAEPWGLLLVLPGGDGSAEFAPFVGRIAENALPPGYLVAQLIAPVWNDDKDSRIVWPRKGLPDPKMRFSTEEFIAAVVRDVEATHGVNPRRVYALGWSSSGPAVYEAAVEKESALAGAFVAMSLFKAHQIGDLSGAKGRAFYILHSPTDFIDMWFPRDARDKLAAAGATTTLVEYEGGHGWHGDVFGMIRAGLKWLEEKTP